MRTKSSTADYDDGTGRGVSLKLQLDLCSFFYDFLLRSATSGEVLLEEYDG